MEEFMDQEEELPIANVMNPTIPMNDDQNYADKPKAGRRVRFQLENASSNGAGSRQQSPTAAAQNGTGTAPQ